jgi:uncharacterized membrane protein YjjB (DUF3815 family)
MNSWALLEQSAWAGVAALGFAILFNVPPRALLVCALGGSLAFFARGGAIGVHPDSLELESLYAATLVSFLAVFWGKRLRAPAVVFVLPAVIPLVPGALAFNTVRDLLELTSQLKQDDAALIASVFTNGFKTVLVTSAMALGVALPSLLFRAKTPMT